MTDFLLRRARLALAVAARSPGLAWGQTAGLIPTPPAVPALPAAPANGRAMLREGSALHDNGDYATAIARYRSVTPGDSSYANVLMELALSYQANKQFAEAVTAAEQAIALGTTSPHLYVTLATAEEELKHSERAQAAYTQGLRRYPYAGTLWFNQGLLEVREKRLPAALASLQRSVELRPEHPGSHLLLAYQEVQQAHPAHAMLGLLTYLALQPTAERSNQALSILERLATNAEEVWKDEKLAPVTPNEPFEELDLLITSRVALRADYKTKVKFNANLVRQTQLLAEKFPTSAPPTDFWVRAYGPLMAVLRAEPDHLTAFTYLILSSARDQTAARWVKANDGKLKRMATALTPALRQLREQQVVAGTSPPVRVRAWFGNDDLLDGLGEGEHFGEPTAKLRGEWRLISDDGSVDAVGTFGADGEKTGKWLGYFPNGLVSREATYAAGKLEGPYRELYDNGATSITATYRTGEPTGDVTLYHRCGVVREVRPYVNGKINGEVRELYTTGQVHRRTTFVNDQKTGPDNSFYPDGTPEYTYTYVADQRQGPAVAYHADKIIERQGSYEKDEWHGPYSDFFPNGQLNETGTYDHGKRVGLWKEYYSWGKISAERTYGPDGELNGPYKDYDDQGRLFSELEYAQGRLTKLANTNTLTGQPVAQQTVKKSGTSPAKSYYFDGAPLATGSYRDGKLDGEWRVATRSGQPRLVRHYAAGLLAGVAEDYFPTGQLKQRLSYVRDQAEGPYQMFHPTGQLAQAGHYHAGTQQGVWRTYYVNGQVNEEEEYVNGESNGRHRSFTPAGKLTVERRMVKGWIAAVTTYDSTGAVRDRVTLPPGTTEYRLTSPGDRVRQRIPVSCGDATGTLTTLTPDEKVLGTVEMRADRRHGAFEYRDPGTGKVTSKGTYRDGQPHGEWQSYQPTGELLSKGLYAIGQREGRWQTLAPNGKVIIDDAYVAGSRDGAARFSNYAGELLVERHYQHGELMGYRGPGADGAPTGTVVPVPPAGLTLKISFANGKPAVEETYRHGWRDGDRRYYYSSGQVYQQCRYVADEFEGPLTTYYPSGKPLEEETYRCGVLDGLCRYYRPDGTLERAETYQAGDQAGPTTYYDAQGRPTRTDTYWGGYVYATKQHGAR